MDFGERMFFGSITLLLLGLLALLILTIGWWLLVVPAFVGTAYGLGTLLDMWSEYNYNKRQNDQEW